PATGAGAPILLNLTLPVTRVGFGVFSFDPVEQLVGMPIAEILSSLLRAPVYKRPSAAGVAVDVYPLALPDGEGAIVPLGRFGELGFKAARGLLLLTVPLQAAGWVQQRFAGAIERGPVQGPSSDGTALVVHFAIRLRPGMKAGFPLGVLGEVGVEAG
ncbi:MAG: hypothetical protein KJ626_00910, partial [Verrucomicrobia bacterium]|nr:hypothetical protein [Verrucomicrobiota bacterium]